MITTGVVAHVQRLWGWQVEPPTQPAQTRADVSAPLTLVVSRTEQTTQLPMIQVSGVLDRRTVAALIDRAADLYANGVRRLLIDLRATPRIELSGLFALHSIARLYRGDPLPNPEDGWAALHEAATLASTALDDQVKLIAPLAIARVIAQTDICHALEVYPDVASAVAAFPNQF